MSLNERRRPRPAGSGSDLFPLKLKRLPDFAFPSYYPQNLNTGTGHTRGRTRNGRHTRHRTQRTHRHHISEKRDQVCREQSLKHHRPKIRGQHTPVWKPRPDANSQQELGRGGGCVPVHSSGTQKINRARTQAEPKRSIPLQRCNNHIGKEGPSLPLQSNHSGSSQPK